MLKIPAKYDRCGIKIKCLKCKSQVGAVCGKTKKNISTCDYKEQHRFNLIVCVPKNPGARRTKILDTRNFNDALIELSKFRQELETKNYHKQKIKTPEKNTLLSYFMASYLDAISGVNTPKHLIRLRSKDHIDDTVRTFKRFNHALTEAGYNFKGMDATEVTDEELSIFHDYLFDDLLLSECSYKKHITIMKTLFNWIIRVKDYNVINVFNHVVLRTYAKEITLIQKSEYEKFLSAISKENSFDPSSKKYLYRPWLKSAYRLALETGLRREELLTIKWCDIVKIDGGKLVCQIDNLKVNRILTGRDTGVHNKYIPVTKSLIALLNELGYDNLRGTDQWIIDRPTNQSLRQAKDLLSRGFTHYIKLASDRSLKFGSLRKTYITKLTLAAGTNAKLFTGSSSDEVLKNHYLSTAFIAANLDDFTIL